MSPLPIRKIRGTIVEVHDITPTARDVTIALTEPMPFMAGSFVNIFVKRGDEIVRRAFSISSTNENVTRITVCVRLTPGGAMSPLFWEDQCVGTELEVMGPLGLNTADKMHSSRVFLFGFGIGAGVLTSLATHLTKRSTLAELTIMTGSRHEEDIVHKNYFDTLATAQPRVQVSYVLSSPPPHNTKYMRGYVQDYIADMRFDNADIYVCGQEKACDDLVESISNTKPHNATFFIEGFH